MLALLLPLLALAAEDSLPRVSIENPLFGPPVPPPATRPLPPIPCTRFDLHGAVQFVKTDCLKEALTHMDVNDRDVNGDTPLHNAIHFWNPPAIKLLLRAGADPHLKDFDGRDAADLAAVLGHQRLYDFLRALERENERLLEALENNDVVAVSNSLLRGAVLGYRDIRLDTVLHRAAQSNLVETGRLLVHHGAPLEARNYLGETPLLTAMLNQHVEFAKLLVESGANVNALDERRRTPLDFAELHGNQELVALLKKKGARKGVARAVEFDFVGEN